MKQKLEEHPYVVAVFLVAISLGLELVGNRFLGPTPPLLLFFGAVAFAAWLGGLGPGIAATALSAIAADMFLIAPVGTLSNKSVGGLSLLLVFILICLAICALFHHLIRSKEFLGSALETAEAAREQAEESDKLKRDFIANMSHEIRAPLSAVLGFSDLLINGHLSLEEKQSYLERLKLNAASLTQLVTDLLDVTEISSTQFIANRKKMALPQFMQKVYSTFAPQAQEKGLRFQVQLRGQIPTYIESDPEQLMQILRQVVGNAIRFSEHGLIKLTVSASKSNTNRREVAFIVTDQGGGIPTEIKKKIFKPFERESRGTSKTHPGTGVGLTIARRLARGLGGDVKLAKSDRKGSTFLITTDAGPVNLATEFFEQFAEANAQAEISPDDPHALEGVKVLVVDDSPDSALLVSRMLKLVGADVETANRGQEGVEKALREKHDIVLMDIQMPEMDGNEATRRLRESGFDHPIIALSAHVMKEDKEESEKSGTDEYLMKPVSRRALLEMVGRYTRRHKAGAQQDFERFRPQPVH